MKKGIVIAMALVFAFALAGCGAPAASSSSSKASMSASDVSKSSSSSASSSSSTASAQAPQPSTSSSAAAQANAGAPANNNSNNNSANAGAATPAPSAASGYISEDDAKSAAVSAAGAGLPEQVTTELVVGGDAPHYVVTLKWGSETTVVEVDAMSGEVWSVSGSAGQNNVVNAVDETEEVVEVTPSATENDSAAAALISEDDAKSIAVSAAGMGLPEQVTAVLMSGGSTPYYEVTLTSDGDTLVIDVDATTGAVL